MVRCSNSSIQSTELGTANETMHINTTAPSSAPSKKSLKAPRKVNRNPYLLVLFCLAGAADQQDKMGCAQSSAADDGPSKPVKVNRREKNVRQSQDLPPVQSFK